MQERLTAFDQFWTHLFSTPIHLDSALAKEPEELRAHLAVIVPAILRAPHAWARKLGVKIAPSEPWSLDGEAIARWAPAKAIAELMLRDPKTVQSPAMATTEDYPPRMIQEWRNELGDASAEALAKTLAMPPPISVRASHARAIEDVAALLAEKTGIEVLRSRASSLGLRLESFARLAPLFEQAPGAFEVQDEGSLVLALFALHPQLFAPLLTDLPGEPSYPDQPIALSKTPPRVGPTVIDCCAGAGGKTLAIADALFGRGRVFAYDVSERRLSELRRRAKRAGLTSVKTTVIEEGGERAFALSHARSADVVLVDAPCSGWGVLKRNPDVKWRQAPEALTRLEALQARLLDAFLPLVAAGGRLVFGACTFRAAETTALVSSFLSEHPDLIRGPGGYFGPGAACDGFFMQAMLSP